MASFDEQETTVSVVNDGSNVQIWTNIRRHITALKRKPKAVLVAEGVDEDNTPWARFTLPNRDWNPATGIKNTRDLTPEQREALSTRLSKARKAQP